MPTSFYDKKTYKQTVAVDEDEHIRIPVIRLSLVASCHLCTLNSLLKFSSRLLGVCEVELQLLYLRQQLFVVFAEIFFDVVAVYYQVLTGS